MIGKFYMANWTFMTLKNKFKKYENLNNREKMKLKCIYSNNVITYVMSRNEILSKEYDSRSDLDDNDESSEQTILEKSTKY